MAQCVAGKDVFLSYGREESVKKFVRQLKVDLETEQLSVWLDVEDIPTGTEWPKEIGIALRECKALIPVVTKKYVSSQYCKSELYVARGCKKPIFPIIREDGWKESDDGEEVNFMIASSNWAMFRPADDYGMSLQRLVEGLKGMERGKELMSFPEGSENETKKQQECSSNWAMFRPADDYGMSLQRLVEGMKGMERGRELMSFPEGSENETKKQQDPMDSLTGQPFSPSGERHNQTWAEPTPPTELLDEPRPKPATPTMSCATADRKSDASMRKKKCNIDPQRRQYIKLILKLSSILGRDPESEALALGRMKLSLAILKGQDESPAIDPEVYRGAKTVQEFFEVMSKYWPCYADHGLLAMVIEVTENKEAIDALKCFLQSQDPEVVIPVAKYPDAPFQPACNNSGSSVRSKDRTAVASTGMLKGGNAVGDSPQRIEAMQVLYNQALTHGYIESRSIVSVLTGAAGSGKTHVKHLLFKKKPPVIRISTALMESPFRAVSLTRVDTDDDDWYEIDDDEQCRMIAAALNAGDVPTETAPPESTSQEMAEEQQPQSNDVPHSTDQQQSADQAATTNHTDPLSTSLPQLTTESALISQADQEPDDNGVGEEIVRLMLASSGSKKLLQADRIYLFDTGGQTIFHELLRLFLRRESVTIFVTKLNERLDHHPMIEYYGKDGKPLSQPHPSPLTHEDILKYSFRAVQSQAYTEDDSQETAHSRACTEGESQETTPKLLIVGTHRDKEWWCSESRKQKNEKLIALLAPAFQRMLLYHGEEMKELIFPVDAKYPGRQDQEVAKELRKAILSAMSSLKSHKTPLAWHILEIALRKLAASVSRSILSRQECLRVARKLHLSAEQLNAALYHFMQLNLILYYRELLPHAVFTDPQIVFDKVTELVQYSYTLRCKPDQRTVTRGEMLEFRDEGVVTLKLLKEFPKHYMSNLFSPSDLVCILEHQLIIAHISEGKYFMPSLLLDLPGKQVERHRVEPSSPAAPFVIYFPGGLAPCGIFCALVASLLSPLNPLHWQLLPSPTNPVRPACVARNCIEFQLPDGYPVALIDSYTHYEVHVIAPGIVCSEVCPQIRTTIFQNLDFATKALHYTNLTPKPAFLCEFPEVHVEEESTLAPLTWQQWLFGRRPTEKAAPPPPHIANFSTCNGNRWICSRNPGKAHGELEERHLIWLRAADSSTTCSQSQPAAPTDSIRVVDRTTHYPNAGAQNRNPPIFLELIRFRGRERRINIPQEIGVHYITFGTLLLEDRNGMRVRAMERKHMRDAEQINMEVLQEWVEGRGKQPVTWDTLVVVLCDTQLTELAIEIASAKAVAIVG